MAAFFYAPLAVQPLPSMPSPTLTNPDMILPDSIRQADTPSPAFPRQQPPSPSQLLRQAAAANASNRADDIGYGRQSLLYRASTPPGSRMSSHVLPDIQEVDTPAKSEYSNIDIESSPTLKDSSPPRWRPNIHRRMSDDEVSSVRSEDLENIAWTGYGGAVDADASSIILEEDDQLGQLPRVVGSDEDSGSDQWGDAQAQLDVEEEEGLYSSAALSRRADMILANAKKRLNLMEGNLRGAHSLLTPSMVSLRTSASSQPASSLVKDRQLNSGLGVVAPNGRYARDMDPPFLGLGRQRSLTALHSSSAMNSYAGAHTAVGRSASVREMRSYDGAYEGRSGGRSSVAGHPLHRVSSDPEPQSENAATPHVIHRSASTTSDLRAQMHELRGRISSLRERALEDGLRRRSLQSLREPNPFTSANGWYSGADGYKSSALTTKTGTERLSGSSHTTDTLPRYATNGPTQTGTSPIQITDLLTHSPLPASSEYSESFYEDASSEVDGDDTSASDEPAASHISSDRYGDEDVDGNSIYADAAPLASRHEDRADAFDYETFFLHSAMGSYSQQLHQRRASVSSTDSNQTAMPDPSSRRRSTDTTTHRQSTDTVVAPEPGMPVTLHSNPSMASISTVASFATATESLKSDDDEEEEEGDDDDQPGRALTQDWAVASVSRPDSAVQIFSRDGGAGVGSGSGGCAAPLEKSHRRSRSSVTSAGVVDFGMLGGDDEALVRALIGSLQMACEQLRGKAEGQYERRAWRRRLDEARRVLDGEEVVRAF